MTVRVTCPEGCIVLYPHRHMDSLERLDWEAKVCGCGSAVCKRREATEEVST